MGTAKKLPDNIAKRWKANRKKNSFEDARWRDIEMKNTKPNMLESPAGKRANKSASIVDTNNGRDKKKKNKPASKDW